MSLLITAPTLTAGPTATKVFSKRDGAGERRLVVKNHDASIVVYIGTTNAVTSSNGYALASGASVEFEDHEGEIWAIAASGTPAVGLIEQWD